MKILFENNRAIGLAADAYVGPHLAIDAPANFDRERLNDYRLNDDNELYLQPYDISYFEALIQARLDTFAQTRGYSNILAAASYATSKIDAYKAEGTYSVDARDDTWSKFYEIMEEVKSGERETIQNFSEIETELPVLSWPENVTEISNTELIIETSNTQMEISNTNTEVSNTEVSNTESSNTENT